MSDNGTRTVPVASIKIGNRHRKEMGDLKGVARSIKAQGLLHPIVVNERMELVVGERRLRACMEILRWSEIPVTVREVASLLEAERDENNCRKDYTYSERLELAKAIEQEIGNRSGQRTDKEKLSKNSGEDEPRPPGAEVQAGERTAAAAAKAAGLGSRQTMERVETVVSQGVPELIEAMDSGAIGVKPAAEIAGLPKKKQRAAMKARTEKARKAPDSQPESLPPKPSTDTLGIPVQDHARDAFEAVPLFDELLKVLRQADKLYSELAEHPGGAYLLRPGISINARDRWKHAGIKTAILNVTDCKPSLAVCPYSFNEHHKHGDDCNLCHGLNWTRPLGKDEVPESILRAAKRHFGVKG
jgi:ParB-like chromosome segregation protein Spo0J